MKMSIDLKKIRQISRKIHKKAKIHSGKSSLESSLFYCITRYVFRTWGVSRKMCTKRRHKQKFSDNKNNSNRNDTKQIFYRRHAANHELSCHRKQQNPNGWPRRVLGKHFNKFDSNDKVKRLFQHLLKGLCTGGVCRKEKTSCTKRMPAAPIATSTRKAMRISSSLAIWAIIARKYSLPLKMLHRRAPIPFPP